MSTEGETVEAVAVVDPAAVATATEKPEGESVERGEDGKFRKPVQPRIDELTRKHRESEREAQYWRTRAETREAQDTAKAAEPKPKPTADQFETYDAFVEALAEHKASEKIAAALSDHDKAAAERQKAEVRRTTWAERQTAAKAKHADYDAVLGSSSVSVADHVIAALSDSEREGELVYHLAQHPELADRLNKLSPLGAARELGRIEVTLDAPVTPDPKEETADAEPPAIAPKKTTAAPPPAKPLPSGRSTTTDLSKAGMDDYVKTRRSQGARWAR